MTIEHDFFDGYRRPHAVSEAKIREADQLIADFTGHVPGADRAIREAFTTSDFTAASTVALKRVFLAKRTATPASWRQYATSISVPDFRDVEVMDYDTLGGDLSLVPELTEYPAVNPADGTKYTLRVAKYGKRFPVSFEAWRDQRAQGILKTMPGALADMAIRTESTLAVAPLVDAAGINAATFSAGNGNAPTALPLTFDNLTTALNAVTARITKDGQFVDNTGWALVVPPTLSATADAVLSVTNYELTDGTKKFFMTSTLGSITKVVEPALLRINKGAKAASTWFLVPKPDTGRPGLYLAFLEGEETPELRVKADQGQYTQGGSVGFDQGSFLIDDIQWRARHFLGSAAGNKLALYASTGA